MSWTPERVEMLKTLWDMNLTADVIACRLGGVSRCAVIGKAHREGLSGRRTGCRAKQGSSKRSRRRIPKLKVQELPPLAVQTLPEVINPLRIPLLAIGDGQCRWPIGDPQDENFSFCGCQTGGASFCAYHDGIAHQQPRERKHVRWPA